LQFTYGLCFRVTSAAFVYKLIIERTLHLGFMFAVLTREILGLTLKQFIGDTGVNIKKGYYTQEN